MKFCYNSSGWRNFPLETAMRTLAGQGYAGIELCCQRNQLAPGTWSAAEAARLRGVASDCGLAIAALHCGAGFLLSDIPHEPSLIANNAGQRQGRLDLIERAMDFACGLGVDLVAITSGALSPAMSFGDAWGLLLDGVHRSLDYAAARNIRLMLEPEPELFVRSTCDFIELRRRLGNPVNFGLNLDIGHAHVLYEDIPAVIRETEPFLWHVHVEDISGRVHKHLPPGEGQIAFGPIGDALRETYGGFVSFELYDHAENPEDAARYCLQALRSWSD